MLDENHANHTLLVNAMRAWHRNNTAPDAALGIVVPAAVPPAVANGVWEIPYGAYGAQIGSIRVSRDNFQVTHVTTAAGAWVTFTYNHVWGGNLSQPSIVTALSCAALAGNDGARSIIILMTSECARSILVKGYITAVLRGKALTNAQFTTVQALTAEYGHTQLHVGGQAGMGAAWNPLTLANHQTYNDHKRDNLHVVNQSAEVAALYAALMAP